MPDFRPCIVVPVFDHERALPATLAGLSHLGLPCILVDDGSSASCRRVIEDLASRLHWVTVIQRPVNGGKGAAVKDGLRRAHASGHTHALQVDADNQHDLARADVFLSTARENPDTIVLGTAVYDRSVPRLRESARKFTRLWVHINTLSRDIEDSLCGFRVYPLDRTLALLDRTHVGDRMDFDVEVLVKLHWMGTAFLCLPVQVTYPPDGVSHFKMVRDNALISWMHARCFFGMLIRAPRLVIQRCRRRRRQDRL